MSATINVLELAEAQANDSGLMELLSNNTTLLVLKQVPLAEYHTTILCNQSAGKLPPLVPRSWRHKIFYFYHFLSHPGITTSRKLIQHFLYGPTCGVMLPNELENAHSVPMQRLFAIMLLH